jgi:hypothetical protein
MWRSPQCWDAPQPKPAHDFRRAVQTHDLLRDHVPVPNVRALTYRYCWPWLPLGIPLRHLTRRLGYRIGPREYEQLVAIGEYRIAVLLAGGEASLQRERAVRATLALRSGAGPSGPKWRGVARHG